MVVYALARIIGRFIDIMCVGDSRKYYSSEDDWTFQRMMSGVNNMTL
jgi:hypothetical protein